MAKKVVAKLRDKTGKNFAKIIIPKKSSQTGGYKFTERIVTVDEAKELIAKA